MCVVLTDNQLSTTRDIIYTWSVGSVYILYSMYDCFQSYTHVCAIMLYGLMATYACPCVGMCE